MALFRSSAKVELDEDMKQIQDSPSPEVAVWRKNGMLKLKFYLHYLPKFNIAPDSPWFWLGLSPEVEWMEVDGFLMRRFQNSQFFGCFFGVGLNCQREELYNILDLELVTTSFG